MKEKFGWIDGLKGISILAVVMLHTGGEVLPGYFGRIALSGGNGVQMFFIISAFLSYKSLNYFFVKRKYNLKNVFLWIAKKFLRLVPLYYLACLMSILILDGVPFWHGSLDYLTIGNVTTHLLLLHGLFPTYCNSFIGVEWYLGALMVFYLLTPLLYKINNSLPKSIIYLWVSIVVVELIKLYGFNYLPEEYNYVYQCYYSTFSFITQLPVYMMGIVLYQVISNDYLKEEFKGKKFCSYVLFGIALVLVIFQACTTNEFFVNNKVVLFGIWFFIITISLAMECKNYIVDNVLFRKIGKYSYGLYLLHPVIYRLYEKYIDIIGLKLNISEVDWVIEFLFTVIVGLGISVLLTKYFDAAVQKLFKCILK